jgi:hypothetical protein
MKTQYVQIGGFNVRLGRNDGCGMMCHEYRDYGRIGSSRCPGSVVAFVVTILPEHSIHIDILPVCQKHLNKLPKGKRHKRHRHIINIGLDEFDRRLWRKVVFQLIDHEH